MCGKNRRTDIACSESRTEVKRRAFQGKNHKVILGIRPENYLRSILSRSKIRLVTALFT